MKNPVCFLLVLGLLFYIVNITQSGCAQIGMPTGGPKDSLPPVLIQAIPEPNTTNFTGRTIRFTFDEYLDIKDAFSNVILSPLPSRNPTVTFNRRSMVVRFRDTLKANTTYNLHFGNAVTDYNEGNVLKDFTYVFSTGPTIDSLTLEGNVLLAESGLADTTLMVFLYKNTHDTAVKKLKPDYITRVKGGGGFKFNNLPNTPFRMYALKDADGGKTYNQVSETFAFHDEIITPSLSPTAIALFAYQQEKPETKTTTTPTKKPQIWKMQSNLSSSKLSLLDTLTLDYTRIIETNDSLQLTLLDSSSNNIALSIIKDSTQKQIKTSFSKQPGMAYTLIIPEGYIKDTSGNTLIADTLRFVTFLESDYGMVTLRFTNLDVEKNPALQFVQNDKVSFSSPIKGKEWKDNLFPPGSYDLRILYDENGNGQWDPGDYTEKKQPEKAITLSLKLSVRAGWETENDIAL